jgi:hypothetical protein
MNAGRSFSRRSKAICSHVCLLAPTNPFHVLPKRTLHMLIKSTCARYALQNASLSKPSSNFESLIRESHRHSTCLRCNTVTDLCDRQASFDVSAEAISASSSHDYNISEIVAVPQQHKLMMAMFGLGNTCRSCRGTETVKVQVCGTNLVVDAQK